MLSFCLQQSCQRIWEKLVETYQERASTKMLGIDALTKMYRNVFIRSSMPCCMVTTTVVKISTNPKSTKESEYVDRLTDRVDPVKLLQDWITDKTL